jgi:hypothetical protein
MMAEKKMTLAEQLRNHSNPDPEKFHNPAFVKDVFDSLKEVILRNKDRRFFHFFNWDGDTCDWEEVSNDSGSIRVSIPVYPLRILNQVELEMLNQMFCDEGLNVTPWECAPGLDVSPGFTITWSTT